jgi:aminodeoxyfutalosine synthase
MSVSESDLVALAAGHDVITLGMLADEARRSRHGARTTFVRVAEVPQEPGGAIAVPSAAGEVRIVGRPGTRAEALQRVRAVSAEARGVPVCGFSLADLEQLAVQEGIPLRALLEELSGSGLQAIAEAPFDLLQNPTRSIEETNIAGLAPVRLTVHRAPAADILSFFRGIADLQRAVGVIRAFAPLPRISTPGSPTTGYEDVKRVALARLVVGGVPSIQVDWSLYGPKLAQVALTVGADDVDAVSASEDAPLGRRRAPLEEIQRNIRAAGLEPVERNGRFEPIAAPAAR